VFQESTNTLAQRRQKAAKTVIKALAPDGQFIIHEIDKIRNY
jgi:hypothetical protein